MEFLTPPSERAYAWTMRQVSRSRELRALVFPLVLESVHPSNFGVLPPAPASLAWKARQIGLITINEAIVMDRF